MILLVAPSTRALPAIAIPTAHKRLLLHPRRETAEEQLRAELRSGDYHLLISAGFAAAADRRLIVGDLLQATRVFGGADIFFDLPPFQAPGAVAGSLCTIVPEELPEPAPLTGRPKRRYPPVYAFDDHAFWLGRTAQAADVPCLMLRAIVLAAPPGEGPHPLLFSAPDLMSGRVGSSLLRMPGRWRDLSRLMRDAAKCRAQLASALTILLVLHERK